MGTFKKSGMQTEPWCLNLAPVGAGQQSQRDGIGRTVETECRCLCVSVTVHNTDTDVNVKEFRRDGRGERQGTATSYEGAAGDGAKVQHRGFPAGGLEVAGERRHHFAREGRRLRRPKNGASSTCSITKGSLRQIIIRLPVRE